MNDPISPVFLSKSFGRTGQSGSGVSGLSSSGIGFNHSGLYLIFGRWAKSMSSKSDILVVSGIGMSSTGCLACGLNCCLDELEGASLALVVFQAAD
ncbi:hypothetical protein Tco_0004472 [Tanacetum coccineum]